MNIFEKVYKQGIVCDICDRPAIGNVVMRDRTSLLKACSDCLPALKCAHAGLSDAMRIGGPCHPYPPQ